jgi:uncharacterized membrane protein
MLVPFPIAFLTATFVSDLMFWRTGNSGWAVASLWLLGAALITAALAALAGLTDFLGDARIRALGPAWRHMLGNIAAVLLSLVNWYWRYDAGEAAVLPTGILISFVVVLLIVYTGWKGGEMVFRGRVGVTDDLPIRNDGQL